MQKVKCLVVEDEPLAAELLEDYVRQIPFLELTATAGDAIQAIDILQRQPIDLIFLDIHLPRIKGIDFIKTLDKPLNIIITSAYQEYALQGFELNVADYLLKPIQFDRFLKAVNRVREQMVSPVRVLSERPFLFFNVSNRKVKIFLDDILYAESKKEYSKIVTREREVATKLQLGQLEEQLPKDKFLRVHRSFIVAKDRVQSFSTTVIEINNKMLPIGRMYKSQVMSALSD
jgi:DNA-binding LytR/AlgR family response regulator